MLQNYTNEVHIVKLPEHVVRKASVISYRNWGEVSAEEFTGFLSHERMLTKEEVGMYALLWIELVEDNRPLRAVINGRVTSVPEDFYDFLIWKRLTYQKIKEVRLIGDIHGKTYPFSVWGRSVLLDNCALAAALARLPEQTQKEIFLYYFQHLTHKEIGEQSG